MVAPHPTRFCPGAPEAQPLASPAGAAHPRHQAGGLLRLLRPLSRPYQGPRDPGSGGGGQILLPGVHSEGPNHQGEHGAAGRIALSPKHHLPLNVLKCLRFRHLFNRWWRESSRGLPGWRGGQRGTQPGVGHAGRSYPQRRRPTRCWGRTGGRLRSRAGSSSRGCGVHRARAGPVTLVGEKAAPVPEATGCGILLWCPAGKRCIRRCSSYIEVCLSFGWWGLGFRIREEMKLWGLTVLLPPRR